jgi:hypothetical protein
MSHSRELPTAASLSQLLSALTETNGYDVDRAVLHAFVSHDGDAALAWAATAGHIVSIDYQLRLLAQPIRNLCEQAASRDDLDTIGTRELTTLLAHWQRLTTDLRTTLTTFRETCATARTITRARTDWVATALVTEPDQRPQIVWIPVGAAGPWNRVKVLAETLADLAREHRGRQVATHRRLVRRSPYTYDLITRHDDGQTTVLPLYPDEDGWYLLTGITWHRAIAPDGDVPPGAPAPISPRNG